MYAIQRRQSQGGMRDHGPHNRPCVRYGTQPLESVHFKMTFRATRIADSSTFLSCISALFLGISGYAAPSQGTTPPLSGSVHIGSLGVEELGSSRCPMLKARPKLP
jgi:hypothetical protein